ncbi:MAG: peptidylprolyl isomerase [Gemmatimonadota bacterium]|jgi:cyclophilin family peptidyl-prolyl cis-trans isomerase
MRRRRRTARAVLAFAALMAAGSGCARESREPGVYAHIWTTKGPILARLEPERTPLAVASFVGLSEGRIENAAFDAGRPFYDGTVWHRVVPGHVIQAGIPASDRARGPGYTFPNEISARLSHDHAGALGVANGGPDTNGSQFYITLADRSYLDGDYIVFGDVVEGMDVVLGIVQGDVVDSVRILRFGAEAEAYHPDTDSFRALVRAVERRSAETAGRKRQAERDWIREHWPDADGPVGGVLTAVRTGAGGIAPEGPRSVRYTGTAVRWMGRLLDYDGPPFRLIEFGSDEEGVPGRNDPARAFPFEPGATHLNAGLDAVIAEMVPGERRVVILPAELGYGRSGLYRPEVPGESRFVIPPGSLLVYDVEVLPAR